MLFLALLAAVCCLLVASSAAGVRFGLPRLSRRRHEEALHRIARLERELGISVVEAQATVSRPTLPDELAFRPGATWLVSDPQAVQHWAPVAWTSHPATCAPANYVQIISHKRNLEHSAFFEQQQDMLRPLLND